MPKKTYKPTKDLSRSRKTPRASSSCSNCSTRLFCICDSGVMIYGEDCRITDQSEDRLDNGDFACDNKCLKQVRKLKKSQSLKNFVKTPKDLASGDHDKHRKNLSTKHKTKSESKIKEINAQGDDKTSEDDAEEKDVETILEYQNANFNDNNSSICSVSPSSHHEIDNVLDMIANRVCPRPVICPVQECGKMIALDSVMLHFYFDHSKVPRMTLNTITSREISLKPSNFSMDTQCFAVFLLKEKENTLPSHADSTSLLANEIPKDKKSLMLMGAKVKIEKLKTINKTKPIPKRSLHTQTDMVNKKAIATVKGTGTNSKHNTNETFLTNEILLLWLCKIEDSTNGYSVTIQRKDKKYAHNYTGEAFHIRDNQDAQSVYDAAECLIVHGEAANRLLDINNEMFIIVNIF